MSADNDSDNGVATERPTERVVISKMFVSLLFMQVCAVPDATDEEILELCNRKNVCGTSAGWSYVVRAKRDDDYWITDNHLPKPCEQFAPRLHFLVGC